MPRSFLVAIACLPLALAAGPAWSGHHERAENPGHAECPHHDVEHGGHHECPHVCGEECKHHAKGHAGECGEHASGCKHHVGAEGHPGCPHKSDAAPDDAL